MSKSIANPLIWRGVLALLVGVAAIAWPGATVLALVFLFAVYAFMAAGIEAMQAFGSQKAGPVIGHLLLGLVDIGAGLVAMVWPGATALVLVLVIASWAVLAGGLEIGVAFRGARSAGSRAMWIMGGLISIAFGVVLFAHPGIGAISLTLLFGLFNLIAGSTMLTRGIELRHADKELHALLDAPSQVKAAA